MNLIAGVGYQHLSDVSFGPLLIERLGQVELPEATRLEDLSYGPIAVVQWFQDAPGLFQQAIFAGAVRRGRPPGMLTIYEWEPGRHSADTVQERVAEAVTGVINLENTLIICDHFGILPPRTTVIEFEPVDMEWGVEPGPFGRARLAEAVEWICNEGAFAHA